MGFFTSMIGANIIDEPQLKAVNKISNDNNLSNSKLKELTEYIKSGKKHIYLFIYWRDCGHCKRSYKDWEKFEKKIGNSNKCIAFAIEQSAISNLSAEMLNYIGGEPSGFPTFRHIFDKKATDYDGERDVESLEEWMKKTTGNKQSGGGAFDILVGVDRIRGQKYEKWLEQRLVSHFNDVAFVNEVRTKFGYDKTNIRGRGQLTKQMIEKEICERNNDERKLIAPNLKCGSKGGEKKHYKTRYKKRHINKKITKKRR